MFKGYRSTITSATILVSKINALRAAYEKQERKRTSSWANIGREGIISDRGPGLVRKALIEDIEAISLQIKSVQPSTTQGPRKCSYHV